MISLKILQAATFAATAHNGQNRLGENKFPYIVHPLNVLACLVAAGVTDENTLCAALLHDVLEDCGVLKETLANEFGAVVANLVEEVTDDPTLRGYERKLAQIKKVKTMSEAAMLIKVADKICNMFDVLYNPPLEWDNAQKTNYFDFGLKVFNAANIDNQFLKMSFSELYAKGDFNEQA